MVWDHVIVPGRSCSKRNSHSRSCGSSRSRVKGNVSSSSAGKRNTLNALRGSKATYPVKDTPIYNTIDAPPMLAEAGMGRLPCVDGPGWINPSREDGEGVSSYIRIHGEGLIGETAHVSDQLPPLQVDDLGGREV